MDLKKMYIERAVYPAMTLLQRNRVTAYTASLQATEFMPQPQRDSLLRQQISELLQFCSTSVPAYSDLSFSELDMRREPLDCLQAVDPVPLSDFLASAEQYQPRNLDPKSLLRINNPSGCLYFTQEQVERYEAARWRGLSWYGVTYGSPSVLLWDRPRKPFFLREEPYMKNRLSLSVCAMTDRSVLPTLEEIDRFSPEYLSGSASALETLSSHMRATGAQLQTRLKAVTVTQGVADNAMRARLQEVFGCPVAQNLGVRSEGILGYMCPEGHLHVTAENCYVEILNPLTWDPLPPGKPGLLAVTDLVGRTMPHLRVILNYMAALSPEPCPCGRTLPVLTDLQKVAPA